jgi:glycosyltransferase involved in cell wall biosynthesis
MVAYRLSEAQQKLGWTANFVTASATDLRSDPREHLGVTLAAAIDEFVVKESGFKALYSDVRDSRAVLAPQLPESDVYHLHWVNGAIDLRKVGALRAKRVVWTLHDMNPFTGGCHHSFDCEGFISGCNRCPAVRSLFASRPPATLARKKSLYATWPALQIVSPSAWLASRAMQSEAFAGAQIAVINNPLDPRFFDTADTRSDDTVSVPKGHTVLVVVAAQLDDPIKGVAWAVEAFAAARKTRDDLSLVLVGSGGAGYQNSPGVSLMGSLDIEGVIRVLDRADVIIIPSLAENSPSVAYEAASRGVWPIVRNTPGLAEVVEKLGVGVLCDSSAALAKILRDDNVINRRSSASRSKLQKAARTLAGPNEVAREYLKIYGAEE